jgi:hypothetical protein
MSKRRVESRRRTDWKGTCPKLVSVEVRDNSTSKAEGTANGSRDVGKTLK